MAIVALSIAFLSMSILPSSFFIISSGLFWSVGCIPSSSLALYDAVMSSWVAWTSIAILMAIGSRRLASASICQVNLLNSDIFEKSCCCSWNNSNCNVPTFLTWSFVLPQPESITAAIKKTIENVIAVFMVSPLKYKRPTRRSGVRRSCHQQQRFVTS